MGPLWDRVQKQLLLKGPIHTFYKYKYTYIYIYIYRERERERETEMERERERCIRVYMCLCRSLITQYQFQCYLVFKIKE